MLSIWGRRPTKNLINCVEVPMKLGIRSREVKWKKVKVLVTQLCLTLCDPMVYFQPDFSVHGILQARILEWFAIFFSRGSSNLGIELGSPALQADSLLSEPPGKPNKAITWSLKCKWPWGGIGGFNEGQISKAAPLSAREAAKLDLQHLVQENRAIR